MTMPAVAAVVDNRYADEIPFPPPSSEHEPAQHHQAIVDDLQTSDFLTHPEFVPTPQPTKRSERFSLSLARQLYTREEICALLCLVGLRLRLFTHKPRNELPGRRFHDPLGDRFESPSSSSSSSSSFPPFEIVCEMSADFPSDISAWKTERGSDRGRGIGYRRIPIRVGG
jgi:hypothetical protein